MKNIKKIIVMIVFVFFLSGCDVSYNLVINSDMNVKEEIRALEEEKYNSLAYDFLLDRIANAYGDKYDKADYLYDPKDPRYKNKQYSFYTISEDVKIGNRVERIYGSISDYKNNSAIFVDLIKEYSITENTGIVTLNATLSDDIYDVSKLEYTIIPNNINININLPFVVTNSNADSKKGNIYTWKISETKRNANIILSFDKNRLSNHIYILNIGISYVILLVIGIIIAVSIFALFIKRKIKGINKI